MQGKPRLILCDIDGTLVGKDAVLTAETRKMMELAHENGILFGLASGRPIYRCNFAIDSWKLKYDLDLIIGMNGAEIYDYKDKSLSNFDLLDSKQLKEIYEIMSKFKAICFVYRDNKEYYSYYDEDMMLNSKKRMSDVDVVPYQEFLYESPTAKMLFRFYDEQSRINAENVINHLIKNKDYQCFKTQKNLLEFTLKTTDKINAIKFYCKKYNIDIQDVVACGDTSNDNKMLLECGLGICLKNGSEDTKNCADVITKENAEDSGLAKYLMERFNL